VRVPTVDELSSRSRQNGRSHQPTFAMKGSRDNATSGHVGRMTQLGNRGFCCGSRHLSVQLAKWPVEQRGLQGVWTAARGRYSRRFRSGS
jgi:hypothetical protein